MSFPPRKHKLQTRFRVFPTFNFAGCQQVTEAGTYRLNQLCLVLVDNLELLSLPHHQKIQFDVVHTLPTLALTNNSELLAGLVQTAILQITSQGYYISQVSSLAT